MLGNRRRVQCAPREDPHRRFGSIASDGEHRVAGVISEVVYVGASTRFVVDLEVGGHLVALQQNLQTSSMEVQEMRGRQVQLIWRREHETAVG